MDEITSKRKWWAKVNEFWSVLERIILRYCPNQSDFPEDGWPLPEYTLQHPQRACNAVIKELRKEKPIWPNKGKFKEYINRLKENEDTVLAGIFSDTWFGLPESAGTRRLPGFFIFCDLCSEASVLYENLKEIEQDV